MRAIDVEGNLCEPGRKCCLAFECVERAIGAEKCVLHQVVNGVAVRNALCEGAVDLILVFVVEFFKGPAVAREGCANQIFDPVFSLFSPFVKIIHL